MRNVDRLLEAEQSHSIIKNCPVERDDSSAGKSRYNDMRESLLVTQCGLFQGCNISSSFVLNCASSTNHTLCSPAFLNVPNTSLSEGCNLREMWGGADDRSTLTISLQKSSTSINKCESWLSNVRSTGCSLFGLACSAK